MVILITTPLYRFGPSAQTKAALDRIYAYLNPACPVPIAIKARCFFVCGGTDEGKEAYKPLLQGCHMTCASLHREERGLIQTGDLDADGALEASGVPARAEEMGRNA